jgi:integrase
MVKLTKRTLDSLKPGPKPRIVYDDELTGFAVRIMPSGFKSFLFEYRSRPGRAFLKKRVAIGPFGSMTADQARDTAMALLLRVRAGDDPQTEKQERRTALTVNNLVHMFMTRHVEVHCRGGTIEAHRSALERLLRAHGGRTAASLTRAHVEMLHRSMDTTPYAANRMRATISSLFAWADRQEGLLPEGHANPASKVKRYREQSRERFLSTEELGQLGDALRVVAVDPYAVAAIRLLLLTGARLREIINAKWEYVDLDRALLNLPNSKTGKKSIFLSAPALAILAGMQHAEGNPHIIPGGKPGQPRSDLDRPWAAIIKEAKLERLRIHDLRHSFASIGAGTAMSLPMIGKLLGHTQAATTQRYAHLDNDPMHRAVNTIGAEIENAMRARR